MTDRALGRRRAILAAGGLLAGALAGCSGDGGSTRGAGGTADGSDGGGSGSDGGTGGDGTADGSGDRPAAVSLRTVATGFQAPVDLADPPGADGLYVADQTGTVSIVGPEGDREPALDLTERIVTGGERGLLGLALHPDFGENRKLYVRYSSPRLAGTPRSYDHTFVLSEFVAASDGLGVDPDSERRLLGIPEPQSNHNAGSVAFGPDGYCYVGVGDGGAGGDVGTGHADDWYRGNRGGNGQDVRENLLGSILRIDVDGEERDRPYGVPDDNPLVGDVGLDEHFAWGFRNPWRFSFDGEDLLVGDVGQNAYEEVDLVRRGGNYGWNVREGTHCFDADTCPSKTPEGEPLIDPVVEYPHGGSGVTGISVIGGYVHRGETLPGLAGEYVFGDLNVSGRLFVATPSDGDGLWPTATLPIAEADRGKLSRLLSFGRDAEGRLYALGRGEGGGGVYELRAAN